MSVLLERAPGVAVRLLALLHLRDARRASREIRSGETAALHDFRVALRRLRTLVEVYPHDFDGSIGPAELRKLRRLTRRSSRLRDSEVQLALLAAIQVGPALGPAAAEVAAVLERRIARRKPVRADLRKRFKKLDRRLRRRLAHYREEIDLDQLRNPVTYRASLVQTAAALADQLAGALSRIGSSADQQAMHQARLAAKRLRYTLEPLEDTRPDVAIAVNGLVNLQDLLGELRDGARLRAAVLERRLRAGAAVAAEFDALANALLGRAARNYAQLQSGWLNDRGVQFFRVLFETLDAISHSADARSDLRPDPGAAENPSRVPSSA